MEESTYKSKGKEMSKSLYSCLVDMNLSAYYGGANRVRHTAKGCIRQTDKANKRALKKVIRSSDPCQLVDNAFRDAYPKVIAATDKVRQCKN